MPKLQTNGAKQKQTTYMILLLWAAVCFALLVVDWCCWAPNRLDADMASEQLLANLLAQEGGVMSTNWYYSTELRVLNTQLVMAPLFRLFTSWHTVRVVGSVVLILLYLAAWFWFGRSAKLKYSGLLGAGLLVLPYGALYRQYVLEGLYYIPHIAISFVVLGCAVRILRGGRRLAPAAGMVLFSFAAALGGPRQLFILNIPLTVAAALLCWLDAPPADTLRQKLTNAWRTPGGALLVPTLAADAAALAGYLVNAKVLAEKYHFQDQGYVAFTGLNLDRLQWFVNALLASFGWQEGKVFSLAALFNLAAAALILFCFVFSVWLVRGKARYPLGHRLVGAFFLAGAVCFALLYGLTNSGHSDRYLLPLAILFVPLLEIMLADCPPRHRPDACGLTALLAAILLLRAGTDYRTAAVATNPNQGAAQFLVQNGYRDGYASFWDGNVMTELTDGTLNVWTLTPNSVPELRPWLQVTSHLQTPPQRKIFFVISKWEAYGERQPTTQALADAMPEDALIYEDETVKIYGFASDEAMRQVCGFAAFP